MIMVFLHTDKTRFMNVINQTSALSGIDRSYIEKDYYVFMLLKLIRFYDDQVMFKGGTSLSRGWGILPRFSEDIDLNLLPEVPSTDSTRQRFARAAYQALLDMGFNYDKTKMYSRREYNTFIQPYSPIFGNNALASDLKIETMANKKGKILNATYTPRIISNYIWDAMSSNHKYAEILTNFGLNPFEINVQNMDVTFVEKVISLTNNYIRGNYFRLSRHLYDIFYMWNCGNLKNFDLRYTMEETKRHLLERQNDVCLRQNIPASVILRKALYSDFYRNDFYTVTTGMKHNQNDGVTYEMCKDTLLGIIDTQLIQF